MRRMLLVVLVVLVVGLGACTHDQSPTTNVHLADPGRCAPVDVSAAADLAPLLEELAHSFNGSDAARVQSPAAQSTAAQSPSSSCAFVRVHSVDSAEAVGQLLDGWPDADRLGPPPALWAPASSAWLALVNQRLAKRGRAPLASGGTALGRTGLVVAMPAPMAKALGWPAKRIGWRDLGRLAANPRGWAAYGHPEWGAFRLGKGNPTRSTAALLATLAISRLDDPATASALESSVVYYGEPAWGFLDNWFRLDQKRQPLSSVSAVVTDERAVAAYNAGSANGLLPETKQAKRPHTPLVAITPADGAIDSDNPL